MLQDENQKSWRVFKKRSRDWLYRGCARKWTWRKDAEYWSQFPLHLLSSKAAAHVQGVHCNPTETWGKRQLSHWSQPQDKETINGPSGTQLPLSITHVPQTLVSCAIVCLAQGWHCLAIYEINKSFFVYWACVLDRKFYWSTLVLPKTCGCLLGWTSKFSMSQKVIFNYKHHSILTTHVQQPQHW